MSNIPWHVCGRYIGKGSGWDQADTFVMTIYDFAPAEECRQIPATSHLSIDFENGTIEIHNDEGQLEHSFDLVDTIINCKKMKDKE